MSMKRRLHWRPPLFFSCGTPTARWNTMDDRGVPHGLRARRAELSMHLFFTFSLAAVFSVPESTSVLLAHKSRPPRPLQDAPRHLCGARGVCHPGQRHGLIPLQTALRKAHFPAPGTSGEALEATRTPAHPRLIFEDCLLMELVTIGNKHEGIMRVPVSCSHE